LSASRAWRAEHTALPPAARVPRRRILAAMSESIVDRYRSALEEGHRALRRGRLEEAAAAYRQAIELGPDRAVPRRSLGAVCLRLGEPVAALTAYDAALELAPDDDEAAHGRAQALVVLQRPAEAAVAYDRLAELRVGAGHPGDACDALRRSLEIEPTAERRRRYLELVGELRTAAGEDEAAAAVARAGSLLEDAPPPVRVEIGEARPGAAELAAQPERRVEPPLDGEALAIRADQAADRADVAAALEAAMTAARTFRSAGHPVAAMDVLLRAQPLAPDDRDLHLLLAELQADRGWTAVAAEKLRQLDRLAELERDAASR
jgi:tetratricopeptide (TPR) repeat protein